MRVTAVVPLKALERAKQRLAGCLDPAARRDLVAFMAARVLRACAEAASVTRVLAVAGDDDAAAVLARDGVEVLVEHRHGLAVALERADLALAGEEATLVIPADLPLARAADIEAVCAAAVDPPCVVIAAAADGGTSALLRCPPTLIATAFGAGSAATHAQLARAAGVRPVRVALPRLAVDVDVPHDLRRATRLDPGLARWAHHTTLHADTHLQDRGAGMPQGTVKHFDIETNTGTILLDDQDELALDAETFAASGLLELRLGQRVRFDIEEDGDQRRIRRLTVVSF